MFFSCILENSISDSFEIYTESIQPRGMPLEFGSSGHGCSLFTQILEQTDDCIGEFIKRKWSSGLFWAVEAAEKKTPNCHKYATFWSGFFSTFCGQKISFAHKKLKKTPEKVAY